MLSGVSERLEQHQDHFGQRRGCFIARRKCWCFHNDDKLLVTVIDVKRQCVGCMMMTVLKSQFSMHRLGSIVYFGKNIPTVDDFGNSQNKFWDFFFKSQNIPKSQIWEHRKRCSQNLQVGGLHIPFRQSTGNNSDSSGSFGQRSPCSNSNGENFRSNFQ